MSYTPIFVEKATIADFSSKITVSDISDTLLRRAERRVITELRNSKNKYGKALRYQDLLSVPDAEDQEIFRGMLEDAAMFAALSDLSTTNGKGNTTVGPITAAGGDGMQKAHSYYSGKNTDQELVSAESKFIDIINNIKRIYSARKYTRSSNLVGRSNEFYASDYNVNFPDVRQEEGNDYTND